MLFFGSLRGLPCLWGRPTTANMAELDQEFSKATGRAGWW